MTFIRIGHSIYGTTFADENFKLKHMGAGWVSPAHVKIQFGFALCQPKWLDSSVVCRRCFESGKMSCLVWRTRWAWPTPAQTPTARSSSSWPPGRCGWMGSTLFSAKSWTEWWVEPVITLLEINTVRSVIRNEKIRCSDYLATLAVAST